MKKILIYISLPLWLGCKSEVKQPVFIDNAKTIFMDSLCATDSITITDLGVHYTELFNSITDSTFKGITNAFKYHITDTLATCCDQSIVLDLEEGEFFIEIFFKKDVFDKNHITDTLATDFNNLDTLKIESYHLNEYIYLPPPPAIDYYDSNEYRIMNPWHDIPNISKKSLDTLLNNLPKDFEFEITDIYDSVKTIPDDGDERLYTVQLLKAKDFQTINWGRGNWMMGPRIVVIDMQKDRCKCKVSKLYYSEDTWYNDKAFYKVTEVIKCETKN